MRYSKRTRAGGAPALPLLALVLLLAALCSCASPSGLHNEEHISDVATVVMPDTVSAGAEFSVTITTNGGFESSRPGQNEIHWTSTGVQITPWDWETWRGPKNRGLQALVHVVSLTFDHAGSYHADVRHLVTVTEGNTTRYSIETISKVVVVTTSNE